MKAVIVKLLVIGLEYRCLETPNYVTLSLVRMI